MRERLHELDEGNVHVPYADEWWLCYRREAPLQLVGELRCANRDNLASRRWERNSDESDIDAVDRNRLAPFE